MKGIYSVSVIRLFLLAGMFLLAACGGGGGGGGLAVFSKAKLVSIEVTPTNPSIAAGTTVQLAATGIYSDNTTQDLTASVTWSSSNIAKVTINSIGLAAGIETGLFDITAVLGNVSGETTLTVTAAFLVSIEITPPNPTIANGTLQQFTATGIFSDNSKQDLTNQAALAWTSSDTDNATIIAGLAASRGEGSTTITATFGIVSGMTELSITSANLESITITPTNTSIAKGLTRRFTATGTYTDNTVQDMTSSVAWESSNSSVAIISNESAWKGLATSGATGETTITATDPLTNIFASANLTVTNAALVSISVTPSNPSIAKGLTKQFTAMGTYTDSTTQDITGSVTWKSSQESVAGINNAAGSNGLATSIGEGSTTITAVSGAKSGSATLTVSSAVLDSISVTPPNPGVAKGLTKQFTATGTYSDNTTQDITGKVTWSSSNESAATISNAAGSNGLATSVLTGLTTITAASGGKSGSATLTISSAVLDLISVTPPNPGIAKGLTKQFTATGTYSDNTTQDITGKVTWSSSNESAATISNAAGSNGLATSVLTGLTTITAASGGKSGSTTLTVSDALLVSISLTPTNPSIAKGLTKQFTATGTYSDKTTQNLTSSVTWASSNESVAGISNVIGSYGLATSPGNGATGQTTITARYPNTSISGSSTLTVTPATLVSIAITPANPSVAKGLTKQFTAMGTYTDNTEQDLTGSVTWSSSNETVATISNAAGSNGLSTSIGIGSTTITAASGGKSGTTTLTVTSATLVSIAVTPVNPSIAKGLTKQFNATGTYTDDSTQDITDSVTWDSSDKSIADISNVPGSNGLASSIDVGGPITITATDSKTSIPGSTILTVSSAELLSIEVTPSGSGITYGSTQQFTALAHYTDGVQDLTGSVTWESANPSIVTISNADGSRGLATAVAYSGSTTIKATDPDYPDPQFVGSTTLSVMQGGFRIWQQTNSVASDAEPFAAAISGDYIYVVGYHDANPNPISNPDDVNDQWRMEKRSLSDGDLDLAFGTGGVEISDPTNGFDDPYAVVADDTSIYVVGYDSAGAGGDERWRIEKRSVTNGQLDGIFGSGGVVTSSPAGEYNEPFAVAKDSSSLYVVGYDMDVAGNEAWRIEKRSVSTGELDILFGVGGSGVITSANKPDENEAVAIAIDASYMYVAGYDSISSGNEEWRIEKRSLQDGSLDLAFGTGGVVLSNPSSGYDEATAIAVDSTYVYVAGYDSQPGSANTRWRIEKRKLSDGSLDTLFGSGGVAVSNPSTNYDAPTSLVVDRTKGYLYVAGYDSFTSEASGKWRIEKRRIDTGALEPSFGAGGVVTIDPNSGASDTPWAIAIDPVNPYIYVSGYATSEGGSRQWQIEKMVK